MNSSPPKRSSESPVKGLQQPSSSRLGWSKQQQIMMPVSRRIFNNNTYGKIENVPIGNSIIVEDLSTNRRMAGPLQNNKDEISSVIISRLSHRNSMIVNQLQGDRDDNKQLPQQQLLMSQSKQDSPKFSQFQLYKKNIKRFGLKKDSIRGGQIEKKDSLNQELLLSQSTIINDAVKAKSVKNQNADDGKPNSKSRQINLSFNNKSQTKLDKNVHRKNSDQQSKQEQMLLSRSIKFEQGSGNKSTPLIKRVGTQQPVQPDPQKAPSPNPSSQHTPKTTPPKENIKYRYQNSIQNSNSQSSLIEKLQEKSMKSQIVHRPILLNSMKKKTKQLNLVYEGAKNDRHNLQKSKDSDNLPTFRKISYKQENQYKSCNQAQEAKDNSKSKYQSVKQPSNSKIPKQNKQLKFSIQIKDKLPVKSLSLEVGTGAKLIAPPALKKPTSSISPLKLSKQIKIPPHLSSSPHRSFTSIKQQRMLLEKAAQLDNKIDSLNFENDILRSQQFLLMQVVVSNQKKLRSLQQMQNLQTVNVDYKRKIFDARCEVEKWIEDTNRVKNSSIIGESSLKNKQKLLLEELLKVLIY